MKHTIENIIIKQLAHNLREKYPELKIEGHPSQLGDNFQPLSTLVITDKKRSFLLIFKLFQIQGELLKIHLLQRNNPGWSIPKNKSVELTNPKSLDHIEEWMGRFIYHCINNDLPSTKPVPPPKRGILADLDLGQNR